MADIPPGSSLDRDGTDRRTYEPQNCGNTKAHGQHIHVPVKGLKMNCPGTFGDEGNAMSNQIHDIRRLPVWAQENIRSLAQEILELRSQIDQLSGAVGASNVFVGGTLPEDLEIPLGMNTRIRFQFPKLSGRVAQRFIDVRHERKHDYGYGNRDALVVQGDGTILIEARATNSLRLILER